MNYLPYTPDVESIDDDEQKTIDGIVEGMTQQTEKVEEREHRAVRASHAKSSACVVGTLIIADDLPPELAQGLFARPGRYPVAVRFAQGPGETLGDRVSTHRGMSIKVFDVEGAGLDGSPASVQDFVFASGTTFPSGTAKGFLRDAKLIGAATPTPEGVKSAVSATMRGFNRVLHALGTGSPKADFFGHPYSHPISEAYFSQCAMRYGDHVAKLGFFPFADEQRRLFDWRLDPGQDEDGFRHAAVAYFAGHEAVFEVRAQLRTDADTQPVEDASIEWNIEDSPYRKVATVHLPRQAAYGDARRLYFDERLTFTPANSLAAHRPLGSVMRARLQVYRALAAFRQRANGVTAVAPTSVDDIPA